MPQQKARKPRPEKQFGFLLRTNHAGKRTLFHDDDDAGEVLVTESPQALRSLAAWLEQAAAWMEADPRRACKGR